VLLEPPQLAVAAQERGGRGAVVGHPEAAAGRCRPPHRQRVGLALDHHRGHRLVVEQGPGGPPGGLADEHAADRGHPLQAGGGVDDVADHALAPVAVGGHHHLAGVDPDPHRELQFLHGAEDGQAAADGPLGVVLVGRGDAEHAHDAVADELVHDPPEPLDLVAQPGVVGAQQGPHVLGVGPVGAGREPGQVAEQHGHDPPLLDPRPGGQGGAAAAAEREPFRDLGTTGRAAQHGASVEAQVSRARARWGGGRRGTGRRPRPRWWRLRGTCRHASGR
jgi:hypothetical protein